MRANSACASSAPASAFCTSGTAFTSNAAPEVRRSRASSCAAFASASFSCASVSVDSSRTSSAPCATGVPRSTGAPTTRPVVSAATSACSSAISVPVARMKRATGCSTAATGAASTVVGVAGRSLAFASPAPQALPIAAAPIVSARIRGRIYRRVMKSSSVISRCLLIGERFSGRTGKIHVRRFQNDAGAQAGDDGVEHVAREQIGIFARREPIRQIQRRDAEQARDQHAHRNGGLHRGWKHLGLDAALELGDDVALGFASEREAFVFAADSRHGSVEKHEREVLRMLTAELVDAPEDRADSQQRVEPLERVATPFDSWVPEQAEALLGECEEDVVLAREVAVDRGRAVLDAFGNLADGDVAEPFGKIDRKSTRLNSSHSQISNAV